MMKFSHYAEAVSQNVSKGFRSQSWYLRTLFSE